MTTIRSRLSLPCTSWWLSSATRTTWSVKELSKTCTHWPNLTHRMAVSYWLLLSSIPGFSSWWCLIRISTRLSQSCQNHQELCTTWGANYTPYCSKMHARILKKSGSKESTCYQGGQLTSISGSWINWALRLVNSIIANTTQPIVWQEFYWLN